MTPEGRLCVRTFYYKGIMNLHIHFQNESAFFTEDQELKGVEKKTSPFDFLIFLDKFGIFTRIL